MMHLMQRVTLAFAVAGMLAGCLGLATPPDLSDSRLDYPDEIDVVRRSAWGWKSTEKRVPEHTISKITIHHGGDSFSDDRDPVEYLRSLQNWSREDKDWIDIPYHFVIDLDGRVYEGRPLRFPGDTNTSYDPR